MKKLVRILISCGVLTMLLLCISSLPVLAGGGIAVGPSYYDIDAVRGANYEKSVIIMNSGDYTTTYAVQATGEAAAWLSLSIDDTEGNKVAIPSGGTKQITVKILVPKDAPNGTHVANVEVVTVPIETDAQQSFAMGAQSVITLHVSGNQILSGIVNGITTADVELGSPLSIEVYVANTGNVEISPTIQLDVTFNGTSVDSVSQTSNVGVEKIGHISMEWDTTGKAPASYNAHVAVSLEGKIIGEKDLTFQILPIGTNTRSGELKGIIVEGNTGVNIMSKVIATFANTGTTYTWAIFTGEIYLDGNLVGVIESEKVAVDAGGQGNLIAYFKPEKSGKYQIKGQVNYEGKLTEIKEIDINITGGKTQTITGGKTQTANLLYVGIGVGTLVVLGVVGGIMWHRKRSRLPSKKQVFPN